MSSAMLYVVSHCSEAHEPPRGDEDFKEMFVSLLMLPLRIAFKLSRTRR